MKSLKNLTGDSLEQMIDYQVVDQNGDEIGTLHSLWSDPDTGAVEFLGVKTGWLFGHNHVVPAEKAELDEANNVVRLPYTESFIKEAPSMSADAEISEAEEQNIYRYYGTARSDTESADTTAAPVIAPAAAGSDLSDAANSRLRRTSRPDTAGGASDTAVDMVSSMSAASVSPDSTRDQLPASAPAATYPTANLYGSTGSSTVPTAVATPATTGLPADTSTTGVAGRGVETAGGTDTEMAGGTDLETYNTFAESVGSASGPIAQANLGNSGSNPDPITGEPGAHPVGTGAGALAAGAAGAAIGGAIGGPIGAPVGAMVGGIIGAVGGGYAGKEAAEAVNPTDENTYWQTNYRNAPYLQGDYDYADYEPAYRVGYEGYSRHLASGRDYADVESELEGDYTRSRGGSRLTWEHAKAATRAAWERLKAKEAETPR